MTRSPNHGTTIRFNLQESYVDLAQGRYGPFRAHVAIKVPLWAVLRQMIQVMDPRNPPTKVMEMDS